MTARKRPLPLSYRRQVLRLAAWLDRRAAALRAHVLSHTPRRRSMATLLDSMTDEERREPRERPISRQTGFEE